MSGRPPQLLDMLVTAVILVVLAGGAVWMLPDHRRPITVDSPLASMRKDAEAEAAARAQPPLDSLPTTGSEVDAYAAANGIDADLVAAEAAAAQAAAQQQAAAEAAPVGGPNAVAAGSPQAPAAESRPGSPPVAGAPAPSPGSAAGLPSPATAQASAVAGNSTATTGARPPAASGGASPAPTSAPPTGSAAASPVAPAAAATDATPTQWYLVAGAYVDRENAERARARIAGMGYAASITPLDRDGKILFRVRAGPMANRDTAERAAKQLRDANLPAVVQQPG